MNIWQTGFWQKSSCNNELCLLGHILYHILWEHKSNQQESGYDCKFSEGKSAASGEAYRMGFPNVENGG